MGRARGGRDGEGIDAADLPHVFERFYRADAARGDHDGGSDVDDGLSDRFYDTDLAEGSLAQTYLNIVVAGARHGVVFPPELVLQAKAAVTAEALDLVLAPKGLRLNYMVVVQVGVMV